jgi:type I restriction enzyme, R subunit
MRRAMFSSVARSKGALTGSVAIVDKLREVTRGYGQNKKPEDYLESFRAFVTNNLNKMPALLVVTQRPRDLTRQDLRSLKLALDQEGFTEKALQTTWRETKNEDIAATIIAYIRQLALGSPLVPYEGRVDSALQRLLKAQKFSEPQRQWLERIATQMKLETVVDHTSLNAGQFKQKGGFDRMNKVFDGRLDAVPGDLADGVWWDAG